MKLAILTLACVFLLPAASVEETINAKLDQFDAAAKAGDAAALGALLAEDLKFGHSSAKFENKAECIAALVKSKPVYNHRDVKIRVYGNTALVDMNMHIEPQGFDIAVLQVWVKKGGDWLMVARHSTRLPKV
ncbi:MAG TPA: nuclear transport factor 2 family protein [Bryobacteraceae bacterium]|nr:nuclear transport factor 2 family protein [Bryobacteraceae bacterium]